MTEWQSQGTFFLHYEHFFYMLASVCKKNTSVVLQFNISTSFIWYTSILQYSCFCLRVHCSDLALHCQTRSGQFKTKGIRINTDTIFIPYQNLTHIATQLFWVASLKQRWGASYRGLVSSPLNLFHFQTCRLADWDSNDLNHLRYCSKVLESQKTTYNLSSRTQKLYTDFDV